MSFLTFSGQVILIAIIPVSFLLLYQRAKQNEQYRRHSMTLSEALQHQAQRTDTITLKDETGNTVLNVPLQELLYLTSADNYVSVHYLQAGDIKRDLLRQTLKGIEDQLKDMPVIRCHRSYIVNLTQAVKLTGNAQGMNLHLRHGAETIPVSRKYMASIKAAIENLA